MKLSTRARYGTRALLDIAINASDKPIQLREIAKRQEISVMYLEHLITPLISAGILRTTRGVRGGVQLTKTPHDIRLSDVIQILEGSMAPVECVDDPKYCPRYNTCVTCEVWSDMKKAIDGVLESITLQELVERQKRKGTKDTMYYI
jgi:Rrf2 family protein